MNKIVIELPEYLRHCPKEWRGYIGKLQEKYKEMIGHDVELNMHIIKKELEQFNAIVLENRHDPELPGTIIFNDEESYFLFKLAYG